MQKVQMELDDEEFNGLVALAKSRGTSPGRLAGVMVERAMKVHPVVTTGDEVGKDQREEE